MGKILIVVKSDLVPPILLNQSPHTMKSTATSNILVPLPYFLLDSSSLAYPLLTHSKYLLTILTIFSEEKV